MTTSWEEKYYESQKQVAELQQKLEESAPSSKGSNEYNADAWSQFARKCILNDEDGIKSMIKRKLISVHDRNKGQQTPLQRAAKFGCYSICQFLINAGADINAKDKNGDTALDTAASRSWYHVQRLLTLAQSNKTAGNEIQEIADNIQRQNGIIDNILNELELIGKQSKELFEKTLMEIMINIINKRLSFDDNLLNLCWRITSRDGQDPLQSELWNAIKTQCVDITQNGSKRDWYWLKKCLLPSTVKFTVLFVIILPTRRE